MMNAMLEMCEEDELGYDYEARDIVVSAKERRRIASLRQMSGQERASQSSRFSRRPAPARQSGAHRRGNKRYGI